jgi:vacuolar-type H+-ATPase subunit H
MDGLDEILRAEKRAGELKTNAVNEAEEIIRRAEAYRDTRLESAQAEGISLTRQLIREAENSAGEEAVRLKAVQDRKTAEKGRTAENKLDAAAQFIAERIMKK